MDFDRLTNSAFATLDVIEDLVCIIRGESRTFADLINGKWREGRRIMDVFRVEGLIVHGINAFNSLPFANIHFEQDDLHEFRLSSHVVWQRGLGVEDVKAVRLLLPCLFVGCDHLDFCTLSPPLQLRVYFIKA